MLRFGMVSYYPSDTCYFYHRNAAQFIVLQKWNYCSSVYKLVVFY